MSESVLTPMKVYAIVTYPIAVIWFLVEKCKKKDEDSNYPGFWEASAGYFRVTLFPRMFDITGNAPINEDSNGKTNPSFKEA